MKIKRRLRAHDYVTIIKGKHRGIQGMLLVFGDENSMNCGGKLVPPGALCTVRYDKWNSFKDGSGYFSRADIDDVPVEHLERIRTKKDLERDAKLTHKRLKDECKHPSVHSTRPKHWWTHHSDWSGRTDEEVTCEVHQCEICGAYLRLNKRKNARKRWLPGTSHGVEVESRVRG